MAGLGGPAGAGAVGALTLGGVVTGLVPLAALGVLGTYRATGCFTPGQDEDRDNIKTLSVCLLLYLYGIKELETA